MTVCSNDRIAQQDLILYIFDIGPFQPVHAAYP